MRITHTALAAAAGLLLASAGTWGQGVGGTSPTLTDHQLDRVYSIPEDPTDWGATVGTPQNPVAVELDPDGPAWHKRFYTPVGGPILAGEIIGISEYLRIEGGRPWTGWEARILTPGFTWSNDGWVHDPIVHFYVTLSDGIARPTGLQVQQIGPIVSASFDPLPAGTQLQIHARLLTDGGGIAFGLLEMEQHPVPEPSTWAAGLLLLVLGGRRRA